MNTQTSDLKRKYLFSGACLLSAGLFTGIWTAFVLTGRMSVALPRLALSAHLIALLGGMWLIIVGLTVDYLYYTESQISRLYKLIAIPVWSGWFITIIASFLGVTGLDFNSDNANNIIALMFRVFVVIPALFGSLYWIKGFCKPKN